MSELLQQTEDQPNRDDLYRELAKRMFAGDVSEALKDVDDPYYALYLPYLYQEQ